MKGLDANPPHRNGLPVLHCLGRGHPRARLSELDFERGSHCIPSFSGHLVSQVDVGSGFQVRQQLGNVRIGEPTGSSQDRIVVRVGNDDRLITVQQSLRSLRVVGVIVEDANHRLLADLIADDLAKSPAVLRVFTGGKHQQSLVGFDDNGTISIAADDPDIVRDRDRFGFNPNPKIVLHGQKVMHVGDRTVWQSRGLEVRIVVVVFPICGRRRACQYQDSKQERQ